MPGLPYPGRDRVAHHVDRFQAERLIAQHGDVFPGHALLAPRAELQPVPVAPEAAADLHRGRKLRRRLLLPRTDPACASIDWRNRRAFALLRNSSTEPWISRSRLKKRVCSPSCSGRSCTRRSTRHAAARQTPARPPARSRQTAASPATATRHATARWSQAPARPEPLLGARHRVAHIVRGERVARVQHPLHSPANPLHAGVVVARRGRHCRTRPRPRRRRCAP